jgi:multidrug resistance efflux pump
VAAASVDAVLPSVKSKLKSDQLVSRVAHDRLIESARADLEKAKLDLQTIEVRSAIDAERYRLAVEEATARYNQVLQEVKLFDESQRAQLRSAESAREISKLKLTCGAQHRPHGRKSAIDGIAVMKDIMRAARILARCRMVTSCIPACPSCR